MKFLFVCSLFFLSIIFGAAHDVFEKSKICMPFQQNLLMDQTWMHVKHHAPQKKKNQLLYEFARIACADDEYANRRNEIAAAIFAGAHILSVQDRLKDSAACLLPPIVLKGDVPLVYLLLSNDADVHELDLKGERAIYCAQTAAMALLLIKYHALNGLNEAEKFSIFQRVMWPHYDPALITLYKKKGFDPGMWDNSGVLLLCLVRNPEQDIVKKAMLLLRDMSDMAIQKMISYTRMGKALAGEIEQKKEKVEKQEVKKRLQLLSTYLFDECPICYDQLCIQICKVTACGHIFHQQCLQNWMQQCLVDWQERCKNGLKKELRNECPVCREIV